MISGDVSNSCFLSCRRCDTDDKYGEREREKERDEREGAGKRSDGNIIYIYIRVISLHPLSSFLDVDGFDFFTLFLFSQIIFFSIFCSKIHYHDSI